MFTEILLSAEVYFFAFLATHFFMKAIPGFHPSGQPSCSKTLPAFLVATAPKK